MINKKVIWIVGIILLVLFLNNQEKKEQGFFHLYNTLEECQDIREGDVGFPCLGECKEFTQEVRDCTGPIPLLKDSQVVGKYTYVADNLVECSEMNIITKGIWNCLYGFELPEKKGFSKYWWFVIIGAIGLIGLGAYYKYGM